MGRNKRETEVQTAETEMEVLSEMHSGDGGPDGGGEALCGSGYEVLSEMAAAVRKGPWMAEEDAILLDYVSKFGPHEWSSIQSKGLLPRSGKSCRLRYVNKLKPGLKSGCKFTVDEERLVLDLQAKFGNKWARIATHLHGRTDNDVKNFWSTRKKKLAKLRQTPFPVKSLGNQRKAKENSDYLPYNAPQDPNNQQIYEPYCEVPDDIQMVEMPNNHEANLPLLEPAINAHEQCLQSSSPPPPSPLFNHSLLDLPLLSDEQDLFMQELGDFEETSLTFLDDFKVEDNGFNSEHLETPESLFGDIPADVLDCLCQPPAS